MRDEGNAGRHSFHPGDNRRPRCAASADLLRTVVESCPTKLLLANPSLDRQQFQVFDFEAMRAYPALLEPLLFYVLHRVASRTNDPTSAAGLKLCVMDEAWRFIQHETLRAYVQEALKTWRKRNAAILLATQTIDARNTDPVEPDADPIAEQRFLRLMNAASIRIGLTFYAFPFSDIRTLIWHHGLSDVGLSNARNECAAPGAQRCR